MERWSFRCQMLGMSIEFLLAAKSLLIIVMLVLFAGLERLWPAVDSPLLLRFRRTSWAAWQRIGRNAGLFAVNALLSPVIIIPITAIAEQWSIGWRGDGWNPTWLIAIDILLLDLWIYWWHRANHEIPLLWRFHKVHHLDEHLDTSSAFRFHFGEVLLSALVRAVVIIILDIPLATVIIFEALIMASAIFHHSDAKLAGNLERILSWIIITPGIHWVHHHAIQRDTDSNYGTIFSFWDRLFSTRSQTERFASMPIGVETLKDRAFWRLLIAPFTLRQDRTKPAPRSARQ